MSATDERTQSESNILHELKRMESRILDQSAEAYATLSSHINDIDKKANRFEDRFKLMTLDFAIVRSDVDVVKKSVDLLTFRATAFERNIDNKFKDIDTRFDKVETRFDHIDKKLDYLSVVVSKLEAKLL